jgi:hypothetical protein
MWQIKKNRLDFIILFPPADINQTRLHFVIAHMRICVEDLLDKASYTQDDSVLYEQIKSEMLNILKRHQDSAEPKHAIIPAREYYELTPLDQDCIECRLNAAFFIEVNDLATIHSDISDRELEILAEALALYSYCDGVEIVDLLEFLTHLRTICFENEYCLKLRANLKMYK